MQGHPAREDSYIVLAALALAAPVGLAAAAVEPLGVDAQIGGPLTPIVGEPETSSCSVPGTGSCTDGKHLVVALPGGPFAQVHGFKDFGTFTGTMRSHLAWSDAAGLNSGERVFTCNVSSGRITGCQGVGAFPANGVDFVTHNCDGTGTGSWGCYDTYFGVDSPV